MSEGTQRTGSRFLYEPFGSAHARIETHEKVTAERWLALERRLTGIETAIDRMEKRMWIAVYGAATVMVSQAVYSIFAKALG